MGYDLALSAAGFDSVSAKYGQALKGGYGTVNGPIPSGGIFTIEAWVKTIASGTYVAAGQNYTAWIGTLGGTTAHARFGNQQAGTEQDLISGVVINDGVWHHLALVVGSSGGTLFVDGAVAASSAVGIGSAGGYGNNTQFGVREFGGALGAGFAWPGEVDEVAIWNTARYSAAFVPAGPISNSAAGLAALWHLDGTGVDSVGAPAAGLTVVVPDTVTAGQAMTVTGTYVGSAPTGLNVQFDNGSFGSVNAPAIGGGNYSFSVIAPSSGSHTLTVQESNLPAVSVVSTVFQATTATTISVSTPASVTAGTAMTISGVYTGVVPSGLSFTFDNGLFATAATPIIANGQFSFVTPAPVAGSHTVTVQENNNAVASTSGIFVSVPQPVLIAPDNAALLYSPYNWNIQASAATSINAGAMMRTMFSGASCTLNFDVTNNVPPFPELWYRIDGVGPWKMEILAPSVVCALPSATSGNTDFPFHLLEVVIKSTTETQNRWIHPSATAVSFTGLSLAGGGSVVVPAARPSSILFYGDSITEGVRTLGEAASNDTDRNDALIGWALRLGDMLGAEVGIVGFGATGLSVSGSGNVPALPQSYALLYQGAARNFTPPPAAVLINIGTNDGAANTVGAMVSFLNGIIANCPNAQIIVLRPFNGNQAANLQAAIASCGNPAICHYVDTTGVFDVTKGCDSLGLHPNGANNLGFIAPRLMGLVHSLLGNVSAANFRGGFRLGLPS